MMAMNAQIQFNMSTGRMKKVTEKLSSGYKINRAADDAAGLSISENMRRQIRGLERGATNTQDGISFCQVADGALSEIHSMLHRMNELCVQAANGTNSDADRGYIDSEIQSLKTEMSRIFDTTEFNGKKIWKDFKNDDVRIPIPGKFQKIFSNVVLDRGSVGADNIGMIAQGDYIFDVDEDEFSMKWTGYNGHSYSYTMPMQDFMKNPNVEITEFTDNTTGQTVTGDVGIKALFDIAGDANVDDVIEGFSDGYIYQGKFAYANSSIVSSGGTSGVSIGSISVRLNAVYNSDLFAPDNTDTFKASTSGNPPSNVTLSDSEIIVGFSFPGLENVKATNTNISWSSNNYDGEEGVWWYTYTDSKGVERKAHKTYSTSNSGLNGIRDALVDSSKGLLPSSEGGADSFGGRISLSFDITSSTPGANNVGSFSLSFNVNADDNEASVLDRVNRALGEGSIISPDLRFNQTLYTYSSGLGKTMPQYRYPMYLNIHSGSDMNDEIGITYEELSAAHIGIENITARSEETAEYGLEQVSKAIDRISSERANFGAQQNRLEHTYDVNKNTAENVQAAESRIRDADLAKEMVEFSKHKMLEQVGESMITQANQSQQGILNLLQ